MNFNNLNAEIARQGLTKPQLAEKMGISKKRLYSRFSGKTDFKQAEIQQISDILHLKSEDIINIFFASEVS